MIKDYLFQLNRNLNENKILISFSGPFYQSLIEELGQAITGYVKVQNQDKGFVSSVFNVFIEMSQNIKNYFAHRPDPRILLSGIIVIGKEGERFFLRSGNLLLRRDREELESRLVQVTQVNKDELKAQYKEQIRRAIPRDSWGAGLGLIDIARKAISPLEYSFYSVDEEMDFYSLNVYL